MEFGSITDKNYVDYDNNNNNNNKETYKKTAKIQQAVTKKETIHGTVL